MCIGAEYSCGPGCQRGFVKIYVTTITDVFAGVGNITQVFIIHRCTYNMSTKIMCVRLVRIEGKSYRRF